MERRTITHIDPTWQNHQLHVGKFCTSSRTWSFVDTSPRSDADAASGQGIPDWLQPFTEGLVEGESGPSSSAGETIPNTPRNVPARPSNKSGGKRNLFVHFRRTPDVINANTQKSQELAAEGILKVEKTRYHKQQKLEDTIAAHHKVLNEENESRLHHRYAGGGTRFDYSTDTELSVQKQDCTRYHEKCAAILVSTKASLELVALTILSRSQKLAKICRGSTTCLPPHQSETNGIAGRAVRRVEEKTPTLSVQSGLDEHWWREAMECCCFSIPVLLADGNTPYERRYDTPFRGPMSNTPWSADVVSSSFHKRQEQASSIHLKIPQRYFHLICRERGGSAGQETRGR